MLEGADFCLDLRAVVRALLLIGQDGVFLQQRGGFPEAPPPVAPPLPVVEHHGLGQLAADAHDRVQGGERVLENHGQLVAAQRVEIILADFEQVLAVIDDFAVVDHRVACQDAHDGPRRDGLAAAGLTYNRQGLPFLQVEGDIPHRAHGAIVGAEGNLQVFDFKLRHYSSAPLREGLNASRSPLPKRLKEISSTEMNSAGKRIMWGTVLR